MDIHYTTVTGRRESNEDAHNIILNIHNINEKINPINLLGIYDGHGGNKVSEFLEKNIPLYYCGKNLKTPFNKKYHNDTFELLQKKILEQNYGHSMGSTCLLNIIYKYKEEYHMNIVNLGDCRLCIVYKNGIVKPITSDHKPDQEAEKIRIENMGGEIYLDTEGTCRVGDLSVSKAFGDGDNAPYISQKPDVFYKKICNMTKYVVMACDGLWDVINNDELYLLLDNLKKNNKENLAIGLATEALRRGSSDNVSVIVIEIKKNLDQNQDTISTFIIEQEISISK
jgi:serine/threonine protein phosphatase PrpC